MSYFLQFYLFTKSWGPFHERICCWLMKVRVLQIGKMNVQSITHSFISRFNTQYTIAAFPDTSTACCIYKICWCRKLLSLWECNNLAECCQLNNTVLHMAIIICGPNYEPTVFEIKFFNWGCVWVRHRSLADDGRSMAYGRLASRSCRTIDRISFARCSSKRNINY